MAAVYSTQFFCGIVPASQTVSLPGPPADQLWVIRFVTALSGFTAVNQFSLSLGPVKTVLLRGPSTATMVSLTWDTRIVVPPGQTVLLDAVGVGVNVSVNGYLLGGPPG